MTASTTGLAEVPAVYRTSVVFDALNVMGLTRERVQAAIAAGVSGVHFTAARLRHNTLELALRDLVKLRDTVSGMSDLLMLAWSGEHVTRAKAQGKLAIMPGLQDSKPAAADPADLEIFAGLGVRIIQVCYNYQGTIGTGCLEAHDSGLTKYGRRFVEQMCKRGIVPDISHCGMQTSLDVIEVAGGPVLCTHSNPRAVVDTPRNKTDAVIEKLARHGGVLCIASYSAMVYKGNKQRPAIDDVMDCYDYALKLVGPDHVGIGSDTCEGLYNKAEWDQFAGRVAYPEVTDHLGDWYDVDTWFADGLERLDQTPSIAALLRQRGHADNTLPGILGANVLRVIDAY